MSTTAQDTRRHATLTEAHREYEKILKSYAFFKVHDRATSEDLVQDTFLKTWSYLVKGGKIDLMKSFLYHVLNNLIVDEYRKHKTASLDVLLEAGYEPSAGDSERLIDALDGKGALLLIQRLPPKYRSVIRMRYVEDLSLAEMSLVTGQSKNAMAVQVHRGLAKLKMLYGTPAFGAKKKEPRERALRSSRQTLLRKNHHSRTDLDPFIEVNNVVIGHPETA